MRFVLTLAVVGCSSTPDAEPLSERIPVEGGLADRPAVTVTIADGTRVGFYLYADGSAGVLTESDGAETSLPDLLVQTGDSPAELFWGISEPGTPVPAALLRIQDELAATGERPAWDEVTETAEQGWLSDPPLLRTYAPCVNNTFKAAHCLPNSPYDDGLCELDIQTGVSWYTAAIRRYHAAFCLDAGTVSEQLYYAEVDTSDCTSDRVARFVWGLSSSTYSANTYLSWTWIAPSGALSRSWSHDAWNVGASDNLDWSYMQVLPGLCG